MFKYANLLEIVRLKDDQDSLVLNFTWHDPNEAKKILNDTMNLTINNLKNLVFDNFEKSSRFKQKISMANDKKRLDFLKEQSSIAKALGIVDNQIDTINVSQSLSLNINTTDIAYYLRGYNAIDKEIELIEQRNYRYLKSIEEEISSIKKKSIKWVDYNIFLTNTKSLKNTKLILLISILLGLILGIFYLLILNGFQSKISSKKSKLK